MSDGLFNPEAFEQMPGQMSMEQLPTLDALPKVTLPELRCFCPDDCNCRKPWRPTYCGCTRHEA